MGTLGLNKLSITLPSGAQVSLESDDRELVRELLYSALPQLSNGSAAPPLSAANGESAPYSNGNGNGSSNGAAHHPPVAPPNPDGTHFGNGHQDNGHPGNGLTIPNGNGAIHPMGNGPMGNGSDTNGATGNGAAGYAPPTPAGFAIEHTPPARPAVPTPQSITQPAQAPTPAGVSGPERTRPNQTRPSQTVANPAGAVAVMTAVATTPEEHEYIAFCQKVSPLGDMRRVVVAAEAADRFLSVKSVDPDALAQLFTLAGWPLPHSFVQTLRNAARTKFRWLERIPGQSGHYRVTGTGRSIVLGETTQPAIQPTRAQPPTPDSD